jgi:hypothetical protein
MPIKPDLNSGGAWGIATSPAKEEMSLSMLVTVSSTVIIYV